MSKVSPCGLPKGRAAAAETRVHVDEPDGVQLMSRAIRDLFVDKLRDGCELVVLCIGTDRSIGDALGPLVGSLLAERAHSAVSVLGTLERPVHAGNLMETVAALHARPAPPLVIAVDACLGRAESVGMVAVGRGALTPGAGVNKQLPAVGDFYVTGVVNVGGFMEYFVLQNTRLHLVMQMARLVADGLALGLASGLAAGSELSYTPQLTSLLP